MDILSNYEKERPAESSRRVSIQKYPPSEYSFLIRLVIRLSGGRIHDTRGAQQVLLISIGIVFVAAVLVLIFSNRNTITTKKNFVPAITPYKQQ